MPRIDVSLEPEEIQRYLEAPRTGSLASLDRDGFPHQAGMWYLPEADRIVMWTYRASQKAVNLRRNPRASLLVHDGDSYVTLRGVLVRGRIEFIDDTERVREIGLRLQQRYSPADATSDAARAAIEHQATRRVGLLLPTTRVTSWDHRKLAAKA